MQKVTPAVALPDPAALRLLLDHVSTFGSLVPSEITPDYAAWLPALREAGWLTSLPNGEQVATEQFFALQGLTDNERSRRVCFAIPLYRQYLLSILAEGLVRAGQLDYRDQLEDWIIRQLTSLAGEINALLDELETGQQAIGTWPAERISATFAKRHVLFPSFANWDHAFLGRSGAPDQLFTAVLSRSSSFAMPVNYTLASTTPPTLLPSFDLPYDDGGQLRLPQPASWTSARQSVYSSLPFFDLHGKPVFDRNHTVAEIWQDALAQQPYYRAVLRLAIAAHYSAYAADRIELILSDETEDVRVQVNGHEVSTLIGLMPQLVDVMNYRALVKPSPLQLKQILDNWIAVGVLEVRPVDRQLVLHSSYVRTLAERRRASALLRGAGQAEQEQVKNYVRNLA